MRGRGRTAGCRDAGGRRKKLIDALLWHLEWGDKIDWLRDLTEVGEAPKALASQPQLDERLEFVWTAFWSLSNDRTVGFGYVGRISFNSIDRYAARLGVESRDEFERLRRLIAKMDAAFVERLTKRSKA